MLRAGRDAGYAEAMPCHVVEEPFAYRQAVVVEDKQRPLFPDRVSLETRGRRRHVPLNVPSFGSMRGHRSGAEGQGSDYRDAGQDACGLVALNCPPFLMLDDRLSNRGSWGVTPQGPRRWRSTPYPDALRASSGGYGSL